MNVSFLVTLLWVVLALWGYVECSKFGDQGDAPAVRRVRKGRPMKWKHNQKHNGIHRLSKSSLERRRYKYSHSALPHISRPIENEINGGKSAGRANKIIPHHKIIAKLHKIPKIRDPINEIQESPPLGNAHKIIPRHKVSSKVHKIHKLIQPMNVNNAGNVDEKARNTKAEAAKRRFEEVKPVKPMMKANSKTKPKQLMRTLFTHNIPESILFKLHNHKIKGSHFKGFLTKDPIQQHLQRYYNRLHHTTARPYKHVTARSVRYKNIFADIMAMSRGEDTSSIEYKKKKIRKILSFIVEPLPIENSQSKDPANETSASDPTGKASNTDVVPSKDISVFPTAMQTQETVGADMNRASSQAGDQTQLGSTTQADSQSATQSTTQQGQADSQSATQSTTQQGQADSQSATQSTTQQGQADSQSATQSTTQQGQTNSQSASQSTTQQGQTNSQSATQSTTQQGQTNSQSATQSTTQQGQTNSQSATQSTTQQGQTNSQSATQSTTQQGQTNSQSATQSTTQQGRANSESTTQSTTGGGNTQQAASSEQNNTMGNTTSTDSQTGPSTGGSSDTSASQATISDGGTNTPSINPAISQYEIHRMKTYIDMVKKLQASRRKTSASANDASGNANVQQQGQIPDNTANNMQGTSRTPRQQQRQQSQEPQRNPTRQPQHSNPSKRPASSSQSQPQNQQTMRTTRQQTQQRSAVSNGSQPRQRGVKVPQQQRITIPNSQTNRPNQRSASSRVPPRSSNKAAPTTKQTSTGIYSQGVSTANREISQQRNTHRPSTASTRQQQRNPKTVQNMPSANTSRRPTTRQGYQQQNTRTTMQKQPNTVPKPQQSSGQAPVSSKQRRQNNQVVPIKQITPPMNRAPDGSISPKGKKTITAYSSGSNRQGSPKTGRPNTTLKGQNPPTGYTRQSSVQQSRTNNTRTPAKSTTGRRNTSPQGQIQSAPQQTPKQRSTYTRSINKGSPKSTQLSSQQNTNPSVPSSNQPIRQEYPLRRTNTRASAQSRRASSSNKTRTQENIPNLRNANKPMNVKPQVQGRNGLSGNQQRRGGGRQAMFNVSQKPSIILGSG